MFIQVKEPLVMSCQVGRRGAVRAEDALMCKEAEGREDVIEDGWTMGLLMVLVDFARCCCSLLCLCVCKRVSGVRLCGGLLFPADVQSALAGSMASVRFCLCLILLIMFLFFVCCGCLLALLALSGTHVHLSVPPLREHYLEEKERN